MKVNANFDQRIVVHSAQLPWLESPMPGVARRMLDRVGGEVARATSIVRYAPSSQFSPHVHSGGEEFIVLEGVFQDEHGDYPVGSYVRNPPQSRHTPGSAAGCVIFVKLWQFDPKDRTPIVRAMNSDQTIPHASLPGVRILSLYQDAREDVRMEIWAPNTRVHFHAPGGAEILVLSGAFDDGSDSLVQHSWLRVPIGGEIQATAGPLGARVWIKTGGLRYVEPPLSAAD